MRGFRRSASRSGRSAALLFWPAANDIAVLPRLSFRRRLRDAREALVGMVLAAPDAPERFDLDPGPSAELARAEETAAAWCEEVGS